MAWKAEETFSSGMILDSLTDKVLAPSLSLLSTFDAVISCSRLEHLLGSRYFNALCSNWWEHSSNKAWLGSLAPSMLMPRKSAFICRMRAARSAKGIGFGLVTSGGISTAAFRLLLGSLLPQNANGARQLLFLEQGLRRHSAGQPNCRI